MKTRDQLVVEVASAAHQDWRNQYRAANGDKPRIKKTKDQSFLDRGITEVDIAALSYPELPSDWQNENRLGAECVVDCVLRAVSDGQPLDAAFVEAASSVAHDSWLSRNSAWAQENQKLPYPQLSEEEKEKDRFFVRAAIAAYQS